MDAATASSLSERRLLAGAPGTRVRALRARLAQGGAPVPGRHVGVRAASTASRRCSTTTTASCASTRAASASSPASDDVRAPTAGSAASTSRPEVAVALGRRARDRLPSGSSCRAPLLRAASARTCSCSTARLSCASVRLTFPRTIGAAELLGQPADQMPAARDAVLPAAARRACSRARCSRSRQRPRWSMPVTESRRGRARRELDGLDQPADLGRADPHQHPVARAEPGPRPADALPARHAGEEVQHARRVAHLLPDDRAAARATSTCSAILIRSPGSAARRPAPRASPASAARRARRPRRRRARGRTPRAGGSARSASTVILAGSGMWPSMSPTFRPQGSASESGRTFRRKQPVEPERARRGARRARGTAPSPARRRRRPGTIGTSCSIASRMKPLRPPKSTRLRSHDGRWTS